MNIQGEKVWDRGRGTSRVSTVPCSSGPSLQQQNPGEGAEVVVCLSPTISRGCSLVRRPVEAPRLAGPGTEAAVVSEPGCLTSRDYGRGCALCPVDEGFLTLETQSGVSSASL